MGVHPLGVHLQTPQKYLQCNPQVLYRALVLQMMKMMMMEEAEPHMHCLTQGQDVIMEDVQIAVESQRVALLARLEHHQAAETVRDHPTFHLWGAQFEGAGPVPVLEMEEPPQKVHNQVPMKVALLPVA